MREDSHILVSRKYAKYLYRYGSIVVVREDLCSWVGESAQWVYYSLRAIQQHLLGCNTLIDNLSSVDIRCVIEYGEGYLVVYSTIYDSIVVSRERSQTSKRSALVMLSKLQMLTRENSFRER